MTVAATAISDQICGITDPFSNMEPQAVEAVLTPAFGDFDNDTERASFENSYADQVMEAISVRPNASLQSNTTMLMQFEGTLSEDAVKSIDTLEVQYQNIVYRSEVQNGGSGPRDGIGSFWWVFLVAIFLVCTLPILAILVIKRKRRAEEEPEIVHDAKRPAVAPKDPLKAPPDVIITQFEGLDALELDVDDAILAEMQEVILSDESTGGSQHDLSQPSSPGYPPDVPMVEIPTSQYLLPQPQAGTWQQQPAVCAPSWKTTNLDEELSRCTYRTTDLDMVDPAPSFCSFPASVYGMESSEQLIPTWGEAVPQDMVPPDDVGLFQDFPSSQMLCDGRYETVGPAIPPIVYTPPRESSGESSHGAYAAAAGSSPSYTLPLSPPSTSAASPQPLGSSLRAVRDSPDFQGHTVAYELEKNDRGQLKRLTVFCSPMFPGNGKVQVRMRADGIDNFCVIPKAMAEFKPGDASVTFDISERATLEGGKRKRITSPTAELQLCLSIEDGHFEGQMFSFHLPMRSPAPVRRVAKGATPGVVLHPIAESSQFFSTVSCELAKTSKGQQVTVFSSKPFPTSGSVQLLMKTKLVDHFCEISSALGRFQEGDDQVTFDVSNKPTLQGSVRQRITSPHASFQLRISFKEGDSTEFSLPLKAMLSQSSDV